MVSNEDEFGGLLLDLIGKTSQKVTLEQMLAQFGVAWTYWHPIEKPTSYKPTYKKQS